MTAQTSPSVSNYVVGKGKVYFAAHLTSTLPVLWKTLTSYSLHDRVYLTTGEFLECSKAGTSGSSEPTVDDTPPYTDGSAEWTLVSFTMLGNCPKLEFTADYDTIDHYSSMEGIKTRDLRVLTNLRGGINLTLDEITPVNLSLGLVGTAPTGTAGSETFHLLSGTSRVGVLRFVGNNEVGPKYKYEWGNVAFTPSKSVGVISEEFQTLELEAFCNKDGRGLFGTVTQV